MSLPSIPCGSAPSQCCWLPEFCTAPTASHQEGCSPTDPSWASSLGLCDGESACSEATLLVVVCYRTATGGPMADPRLCDGRPVLTGHRAAWHGHQAVHTGLYFSLVALPRGLLGNGNCMDDTNSSCVTGPQGPVLGTLVKVTGAMAPEAPCWLRVPTNCRGEATGYPGRLCADGPASQQAAQHTVS